jgi:hypothetical protein
MTEDAGSSSSAAEQQQQPQHPQPQRRRLQAAFFVDGDRRHDQYDADPFALVLAPTPAGLTAAEVAWVARTARTTVAQGLAVHAANGDPDTTVLFDLGEVVEVSYHPNPNPNPNSAGRVEAGKEEYYTRIGFGPSRASFSSPILGGFEAPSQREFDRFTFPAVLAGYVEPRLPVAIREIDPDLSGLVSVTADLTYTPGAGPGPGEEGATLLVPPPPNAAAPEREDPPLATAAEAATAATLDVSWDVGNSGNSASIAAIPGAGGGFSGGPRERGPALIAGTVLAGIGIASLGALLLVRRRRRSRGGGGADDDESYESSVSADSSVIRKDHGIGGTDLTDGGDTFEDEDSFFSDGSDVNSQGNSVKEMEGTEGFLSFEAVTNFFGGTSEATSPPAPRSSPKARSPARQPPHQTEAFELRRNRDAISVRKDMMLTVDEGSNVHRSFSSSSAQAGAGLTWGGVRRLNHPSSPDEGWLRGSRNEADMIIPL